MLNPITVLVGEGTAEPTTGFSYVEQLFAPHPVIFYFGVRRTTDGLDTLQGEHTRAVANFPGRGMAGLSVPVTPCNLSTFAVSRAIATGRLQPDAVLIVATPPDASGNRSAGTANGPIQAAIDRAPLIIVEEHPDLPVIRGAATIPAGKKTLVIGHREAAFAALTRPPAALDFTCAEHIAPLIPHGAALQLGVGGIIDALSQTLAQHRQLRSISGAIGGSVRTLWEQNCLNPAADILGSAIVGDDALVQWAASNPNVGLLPSAQIHNPAWISRIDQFHSVNVGLTIDREGNINAESIGSRMISGRGGSPNFSKGASLSPGGKSIVAIRTDRGGALVEKIRRPTIPALYVDFLVTERGAAELRGKTIAERRRLIEQLCS